MKKFYTLLLVMALGLIMTACGGKKSSDVPVVELTELKTAVSDALGENYFPAMPMEVSFFEDFGLKADMCADFLCEMPMINTNVDTLMIVRAAEGKVADVEAAVNSYRDMLVADTMQYPMNIGKIQASSVETIGDYVIFVQLGGDVMAAAEEGDEAVVAQCQEQNTKALDAIKSVLGQ